MTPREGEPGRAVLGVRGLVVFVLVFGGFVAMHGVAVTTETGVHHNPVVLLADPDHRAATGSLESAAPPGQHQDGDNGHATMMGCVVVLLGAVAALLLRHRTPWRVLGTHSLLQAHQTVRKRPNRPFGRHRRRICLCVLRV